MKMPELSRTFHLVRAKLRDFVSPYVLISSAVFAVAVGVTWEYFGQLDDSELAETAISDFLSGENSASELSGDISEDNASIAADIDSSNVLRDELDESEANPAPVPPRPRASESAGNNADRNSNVQALFDLLSEEPDSPSDDGSNGNESSNLLLRSMMSGNEDESGNDTGLFGGASDPTNLFSTLALPSATPQGNNGNASPNGLQLGITAPPTQNLGLSSSPAFPENETRNRRNGDRPTANSNNAANRQPREDGRATSAETLPDFATPPPTNLYDRSNDGFPSFTGYPTNPGNTNPANPYGQQPPSPNFDPGRSGNPSNGYRRPTYRPNVSPSNNPGVTNPYGNTGGNYNNFNGNNFNGGFNGGFNGNNFNATPDNPYGGTYRGTPNNSGYPNSGYPNTTPNATQGQPNTQQPQPYSVPRTPPGRAIGNGDINTFGNP